MKTRNKKILIMLASILLFVVLGTTTVFGLTPSELNGATVTDTTITDLGKKIIGVLQTVGIVLSVVILVVLGLKYMMGSAEEKADYKKTMIPYLVGAFCIFLAPTIANMVYNLIKTTA